MFAPGRAAQVAQSISCVTVYICDFASIVLLLVLAYMYMNECTPHKVQHGGTSIELIAGVKVTDCINRVRVAIVAAAYPQGERQIKYEVVHPTRPHSSKTRPLSSKTRPSSAHHQPQPSTTATAIRRPPSGKKTTTAAHTKPTVHVIPDATAPANDAHAHEALSTINDVETGRSSVFSGGGDSERNSRIAFDPEAFRKLGIDLAELERVERGPPISVDVTQPQSVIDFQHDVSHMHSMEQEITRNALALQKRLGLDENGLL